jgi:chromate reductase
MATNTAQGMQFRVLGISGSLRKASFNSGLLRAAQTVAPTGVEISIFDIRNIPFYDGYVEAGGDPQPVIDLKHAIRQSDGVLFATPEYNWGTSRALKNAIDWASRDKGEGSLMGKPATIVGAGGRSGTARAQMQLQQTLAETGSLVLTKPGLLVAAFAPMKFDDNGDLADDDTKRLLGSHLEEFTKWMVRLASGGEFVRHACEMDIQSAAD